MSTCVTLITIVFHNGSTAKIENTDVQFNITVLHVPVPNLTYPQKYIYENKLTKLGKCNSIL